MDTLNAMIIVCRIGIVLLALVFLVYLVATLLRNHKNEPTRQFFVAYLWLVTGNLLQVINLVYLRMKLLNGLDITGAFDSSVSLAITLFLAFSIVLSFEKIRNL